jgi:chemotaxis signal transduction protein
VVDELFELKASGVGDFVPVESILPGYEMISGLVKTKDGVIVIADLEKFLTDKEADVLDDSLAAFRLSAEVEGTESR